jgi:hypothetical protein
VAPVAPRLRQPFVAPVAGPRVFLAVDNPAGRLQQLQYRWTDVCFAPCGVAMDPATIYRIGGGSSKPSPTFRLPRSSGDVRVQAHVGSIVKYWVGFGLSIGGGAAAAGGGVLFASSTGSNDDFDKVLRVYGVLYLVAGVVLLAVGLPLLLTNDTTVEVR